jgi:NAD(P)-dependent dehydrogenase (short-subunit alcohol dehydrogenase family)
MLNPTPPFAKGTLLLIGGTSDIGRATALAYAARGWSVQLAGRKLEALEREAQDLRVRHGGAVTIHCINVLASETFQSFADGLPTLPDVLVCVVGALGDQSRAQTDLAFAAQVIRVNFEGPALLLGVFAERFARRGSGAIAGVSSVAGDRGRGSNYLAAELIRPPRRVHQWR